MSDIVDISERSDRRGARQGWSASLDRRLGRMMVCALPTELCVGP